MIKQKKSKVRQSTERPIVNEMRVIDGWVKIWSGKAWLTEQEHAKLFIDNEVKR